MSRPTDPRVTATDVGRLIDDVSHHPLRTHGPGNPSQARAPPPRLGYSIEEFCGAVGISVAFYYKLRREGKTPREMSLGTRRIISADEAQLWCAQRTAQATGGEAV
jgi:hypothetical protein